MGCSSSVMESHFMGPQKKRGTFSSITTSDSHDSIEGAFGMRVLKRYGHPTYFRNDGYDIGLRVRVRGVYQSTFVGCARRNLDKVSIKEHNLLKYPSAVQRSDDNNDSTNNDDNKSVPVNEAIILSRLNHENIPKLMEVFITETSLFLVTNYVDPFRLTNFLDTSAQTTSIHPADAMRIFKSLASALVHCHDHNVVVRDLTPSNIMFKRNGVDVRTGGALQVEVLIADFSLAAIVPTNNNNNNKNKRIVNADNNSNKYRNNRLPDHPLFEWKMVEYASPEAILGNEMDPISTSMDMWSLGVLLYVMLSGIEPFHHEDDHVLVQNIRTAHYDFEEDAFDNVSNDIKGFIAQLLVPSVTDRLTARELIKLLW